MISFRMKKLGGCNFIFAYFNIAHFVRVYTNTPRGCVIKQNWEAQQIKRLTSKLCCLSSLSKTLSNNCILPGKINIKSCIYIRC